MVTAVKDSFLDLERHRQALEDNVAKLRKALNHWQTWELEYEGLKEEIAAVKPPTSPAALATLCHNYESTVLTKSEINDILGTKNNKSPSKTVEQVTNVLERRVDYVQQNVKTIEKQLETAEEKLAKATVISAPDVRDEEGLPLMEITEELDKDGNVISGRAEAPGNSKQQLLEVLQKAGVDNLPSPEELQAMENARRNKDVHRIKDEERIQEVEEKPMQEDIFEQESAPVKKRVSFADAEQPTSQVAEEAKPVKKRVSFAGAEGNARPAPAKPQPKKKTVSFAQEVEEHEDDDEDTEMVDADDEPSRRIEDLIKKIEESNKPGFSEPPIIPVDESPEDAELRRQMIEYGMSDIGAIVGELNLEEGSASEDEDEDDRSSMMTDDEDEYGRSTTSVITEEYRKQMIELEKKLNARMMQNVGPEGPEGDDDVGIVHEGIGRVTINRQAEDVPETPTREPATSAKKGKKGVRFADDLDISPAPEQTTTKAEKPQPRAPTVAPLGDIVERKPPASTTPSPAPAPKKVSRFKQGLSTATQPDQSGQTSLPTRSVANATYGNASIPLFPAAKPKTYSSLFPPPLPPTPPPKATPTGPPNKTLAPEIVEREVSDEPIEPDEFDAQLLKKEIDVEYHRQRNRMIQRQGGFGKENESAIIPLTEEEGGPKKVSRFKAARLAMG